MRFLTSKNRIICSTSVASRFSSQPQLLDLPHPSLRLYYSMQLNERLGRRLLAEASGHDALSSFVSCSTLRLRLLCLKEQNRDVAHVLADQLHFFYEEKHVVVLICFCFFVLSTEPFRQGTHQCHQNRKMCSGKSATNCLPSYGD